jgi:hypothetical protein
LAAGAAMAALIRAVRKMAVFIIMMVCEKSSKLFVGCLLWLQSGDEILNYVESKAIFILPEPNSETALHSDSFLVNVMSNTLRM